MCRLSNFSIVILPYTLRRLRCLSQMSLIISKNWKSIRQIYIFFSRYTARPAARHVDNAWWICSKPSCKQWEREREKYLCKPFDITWPKPHWLHVRDKRCVLYTTCRMSLRCIFQFMCNSVIETYDRVCKSYLKVVVVVILGVKCNASAIFDYTECFAIFMFLQILEVLSINFWGN